MTTKDEYKAALAGMDDEKLTAEVDTCVWFSAFASNNPRSEYHWKVDLAYDECKARGKPWLYQRGYNKAYRSCGYLPSEDDIERAKPSFYEEAVE